MENPGVQKAAAELSAEEAAYDRGYDDGFAARDKLAASVTGPAFKDRVLVVLREVGLLGNISPCP